MSEIIKPEYPRPQLVRQSYINLNGCWEFEIDDSLSGKEKGIYKRHLKDRITVPFCPESELSGLEGCTTSLTVGKDKIRLRRTGEALAVDTVMEFEKGKRFLGYYETPYGPLGMEILTNSIEKITG